MEFGECLNRADHLIQQSQLVLPNANDLKKLPQFEKKLQLLLANSIRHNSDSKLLHHTSGLLRQMFENDEEQARLILCLLPPGDGYCLNVVNKEQECLETLEFSYDDEDFLEYFNNETIPPMLTTLLDDICPEIFIIGCILTEVRDYRVSATPMHYKTTYVMLKPSSINIMEDVNGIVNSTSELYKWTTDDKLALESTLTLATSEPLCLDPSPTVMMVKTKIQNQNLFQTNNMKRRIKSCSALSQKRRKVLGTRKLPRHLFLHEFLKEKRSKEKKTTEIRLDKNIIDTWRKEELVLSPPTATDVVGVEKLAKPIQWPENLSDKDILEVQTIHLESEGPNRDVYSRITIGQRPGDMKYFGTLHSNKYYKQSSNESKPLIPQCVFSLGSEHRANLYILQYQELFTEEGRRLAKVTVNKSGQSGDKTFFIPNQQQPWELIQDKLMYSVGSVVDIPVQQWNNLKMKRSHNKLELNSTLHHRPTPTANNKTQKQQVSKQTPVTSSSNQNQHIVISNGQNIGQQQLIRTKSAGAVENNDIVIVNSQPIRVRAVTQAQNVQHDVVKPVQNFETTNSDVINMQQQQNFKTILTRTSSQHAVQSTTNPQQTTTVVRMPIQSRSNSGQVAAINLISTSTGQSLIGPNGAVLGNIQITAGPGGSLTIPASQLSAAGITMQLNSRNKGAGVPQQITLVPTNTLPGNMGQHLTLVNQNQNPRAATSTAQITLSNMRNWQVQGQQDKTQNVIIGRTQPVVQRSMSQDQIQVVQRMPFIAPTSGENIVLQNTTSNINK